MEETCIVSNEENEDKENNELDDYLEHDTIFYTSKKTNNFDTFFGDGKNYNIASTSTDDFLQDENIKQKKIFSPLSDYEKSTLLFKISLVLLSMIEGRKVKDEVIKKILRDLNYKLVFEKCGEIYTKLTCNIMINMIKFKKKKYKKFIIIQRQLKKLYNFIRKIQFVWKY